MPAAKPSGKPSAKLQALVHAGLISAADAKKLPKDLLARIESLSEAEVTHLCAAKAKLGEHHKGPNAMIFI